MTARNVDGATFVTVEVQDRTAWVSLARPPVNALSVGVLEQLAGVVRGLAEDFRVRAIVLRGAGSGFAAGGDIEELLAVPADQALEYARRVQESLSALATCPKPTIAAVHGFALGGGTELALACDMRVAADDALFGLPETQLGLIPGVGGTFRLRELVGRGRAKALIMSGRTIKAAEALSIGLVDAVVPRENLEGEARRRARWFAASSPAAMRAAKALVDGPVEGAAQREAAAFAQLLAGDDAKQGLAAFLEHGRTGHAEFRS